MLGKTDLRTDGHDYIVEFHLVAHYGPTADLTQLEPVGGDTGAQLDRIGDGL